MVKAKFLMSDIIKGVEVGLIIFKGQNYISWDAYNAFFVKEKNNRIVSKIELVYTKDFKRVKQGFFVKFDTYNSAFLNDKDSFLDIKSLFDKNTLEFSRADFVLSKKNFNLNTKNKIVKQHHHRDIRTFPVTVIAKEYGLSALKMNKLLYMSGIQYKAGGKWNVYSPFERLSLTSLNYKWVRGKKQYRSVTWTNKGVFFIERYLLSLGIDKIKYVNDKTEHFHKINSIINSDTRMSVEITDFWVNQVLA